MQWLKTWLRKWLGIDAALVKSDADKLYGEIERINLLHTDLVRQVGIQESNTNEKILVNLKIIEGVQRWSKQVDADNADNLKRFGDIYAKADALRELITATGENFTLRMEDLSRRVIDLETEPTQEISNRQEDSPGGRGSFAEIVAEIERANGIR